MSMTCRKNTCWAFRAFSVRVRSILIAIRSATDSSICKVNSVRGWRANIAITPMTRPSTSSGYPAKATIPSRSAHSCSGTRGSPITVLVKWGLHSEAIIPILNCPTGIWLCGPSRCVYKPELACNSKIWSCVLRVHILANARICCRSNCYEY